jgi:hypothetical protein
MSESRVSCTSIGNHVFPCTEVGFCVSGEATGGASRLADITAVVRMQWSLNV